MLSHSSPPRLKDSGRPRHDDVISGHQRLRWIDIVIVLEIEWVSIWKQLQDVKSLRRVWHGRLISTYDEWRKIELSDGKWKNNDWQVEAEPTWHGASWAFQWIFHLRRKSSPLIYEARLEATVFWFPTWIALNSANEPPPFFSPESAKLMLLSNHSTLPRCRSGRT